MELNPPATQMTQLRQLALWQAAATRAYLHIYVQHTAPEFRSIIAL